MPFLDRLYMAATHMTHDGAHAEELIQKTYLQAFRVFGALTAGTDLKVWLFQLLAGSAFHTTGEWARSSSSTACPCRRPTEKHHPRFREPETPDAQALERLPDQEVKAAFRRLPQELAIIVHLADAEDFSPTEIAVVLGISENTAISLLLHGRHCLLQAFIDASRRQDLLDR
ncbi:sigma factor-like helix-turn-helix DNA-binding protein [Streptomyces sp. NRRL B-24720]|uniref:sigma factor-like helix-turn-helix DNA-binding protein n=1 Tax=Streptomyces sp. NRRL B-24720 TaxID=1476876 RepID=UPI0004C75273|nr:sigma factor-like helix-turn-helix DNA-binding protein [Streptomyces sp. NRRL B-24720]